MKSTGWRLILAVALSALLCAACKHKAPAPIKGMVRLAGGTFTMGCVKGDKRCRDEEKPAHRVTISPFFLDEHPVTVAEYHKCLEARACKPAQVDENEWWRRYDNLDRADRFDHPANGVDWDGATAYCHWAGKRLPTEAEFEYALRGGKEGLIYAWGDTSAPPPKVVVKEPPAAATPGPAEPTIAGGMPPDHPWEGTLPVCASGRNPFGLCDMTGNVWEWCSDWYDGHYYAASPARDPKGPKTGEDHVLRGSTPFAFPELRRASYRESSDHDFFAFYVGFRCAKD